MAGFGRFRHFSQNFTRFSRQLTTANVKKVNGNQLNKYLLVLSGGIAVVTYHKWKNSFTVQALQLRKDELTERAIKLSAREKRFIKFASVEFDGQIYMTPQDFLESVVEQEPRPRLKRKQLTAAEIQHLKDDTPSLKRGSPSLFRGLRDRGIISYTEYLFLLSVLTKPTSGFRIAFNMFDTDGNQRVDKDEFLVMEKIFSFAWKGKRGMDLETPEGENKENGEANDDQKDEKNKAHHHYVDDEQGLQRKHKVDTTLQIHFFGKKGNKELQFEGFKNFMQNLQTEVLEIEFCEFSKGHERISEVDFAKILLRYTYLDTDEYDSYLDRLLDRDTKERGVSFEEFKAFCQFLNNLDDFAIAMRMYTLADQAISKDEFSRAVKICTGSELNKHLIETVFAIFDEDGDGLLSYKEFIAIMKDRLHRGFKVSNYLFTGDRLQDDFDDELLESKFRLFALLRSRACRRLRRDLARHLF
ncbi:calcium uptake protein 3, mitochondrial isoform X2 [Culicoides brevitarsis]|uniref:calcium uptake protein 3, mitochondrial isoform X2 n=1 Tax=Culicoides brevitarsis TaxID=469753 RepID=UPI00307BF9AF